MTPKFATFDVEGVWETGVLLGGNVLVLQPLFLPVRTRVNGDVLQNGNTRNMIFGVAEIIAFLARIITLQPGDIIATRTPAGVAASHQPARFLNAGDVVEVEIEIGDLGTLRNPVGEPA